jgi:hypothetical protein
LSVASPSLDEVRLGTALEGDGWARNRMRMKWIGEGEERGRKQCSKLADILAAKFKKVKIKINVSFKANWRPNICNFRLIFRKGLMLLFLYFSHMRVFY